MLDHTPSVYEFFYKFTSDSTKGSTIQSVFAHAMKKDMRELIKKYEADMVICTEKDFVKLKDIYEIPKLHVLAIEFNILEDNICWNF